MLSVSKQMRADQCSALQITEANVKVKALSLRTFGSTRTRTHTHGTRTLKTKSLNVLISPIIVTNISPFFPFFNYKTYN